VPYDPTPVGADVGDDGTRESLTVQVQGGRGDPERVFVLSRPRNDLVEVREFGSSCAAAAPRSYTESTDILLRLFEKAVKQKRRVSQEMYLIRQWLGA
jgi:hypothetical protein